MNSRVKLYLYNDTGTETYIDIYKAIEFDEFTLVSVDTTNPETVHQVQEILSKVSTSKQFIVFPEAMNISFYGVREEDDNRLISGELSNEGLVEETSRDIEL